MYASGEAQKNIEGLFQSTVFFVCYKTENNFRDKLNIKMVEVCPNHCISYATIITILILMFSKYICESISNYMSYLSEHKVFKVELYKITAV